MKEWVVLIIRTTRAETRKSVMSKHVNQVWTVVHAYRWLPWSWREHFRSLLAYFQGLSLIEKVDLRL